MPQLLYYLQVDKDTSLVADKEASVEAAEGQQGKLVGKAVNHSNMV